MTNKMPIKTEPYEHQKEAFNFAIVSVTFLWVLQEFYLIAKPILKIHPFDDF